MNQKRAPSAIFTGRAVAHAGNHPLQRNLKFIFTDFAPNGNKQGVPRSEAENVVRSSLFMPVKINFDGAGPAGHTGADPIGPITNMVITDDQIIGEAVVWIDEFPHIDDYLMRASANNGEGVQFSWELYFQQSERDTDGVEWLYGITSAGICIVESPAYRGRTPLIAIAEGTEMDELEAQVRTLSTRQATLLDALWALLAHAEPRDPTAEPDTEVQHLLASLSAQVQQAQATQQELSGLRTELADLRAFREQVELAASQQQLLATRREQLIAAGLVLSDEVFAERTGRIVAMSDDLFASYVADLAAARAEAKSDKTTASEKRGGDGVMPDPQASTNMRYSIADLAAALRSSKTEKQ